MKAIILAAGQGRRLLPLTESIPKCCLRLEGKTMLEWQTDALAANDIEEAVVVTGFGRHVVEAVASQIDKIPVRTLYNPFYSLSDNLGTCWLARHEMTEPFVLLNGDTLFEFALLRYLLRQSADFPITLATDRKEQYDEDDMKVIAEQSRLLRVGKRLAQQHVNAESIGLMVFSESGAAAFVRQVEHLMSGPEGLARWFLSAIDDLAHEGLVGICCIHGFSWCEVDDFDDLQDAGQVVRGWLRQGAATDTLDAQTEALHARGLSHRQS